MNILGAFKRVDYGWAMSRRAWKNTNGSVWIQVHAHRDRKISKYENGKFEDYNPTVEDGLAQDWYVLAT